MYTFIEMEPELDAGSDSDVEPEPDADGGFDFGKKNSADLFDLLTC